MLSMFSWIQRLFIYILNKSVNKQLREVAKKYNNLVLVGIPGLVKRFLAPGYAADRLHPNDKALRIWSDIILNGALKHPSTKKLLSDFDSKL